MPKSTKSTKGEGNTKPPPTPFRRWVFTLNNYINDQEIELYDHLQKTSLKGVIGKEIGDQTHTPHLQGYLVFKDAKSLGGVSRLFLGQKPHLEKAKGDDDANFKYCSKDGDFVKWGEWAPQEPIYDAMEELTFKPWQNQIIEIIKGSARNRDIWWFWESKGGVGKTLFSKHLKLKYDAMYLTGKAADMKYLIARRKIPPKIIIMDFPKDSQDYISYSGIEEIKNGIFMSGKLESKEYIMNQPHIICFANREPEPGRMSVDKFKVVCIDESEENDDIF